MSSKHDLVGSNPTVGTKGSKLVGTEALRKMMRTPKADFSKGETGSSSSVFKCCTLMEICYYEFVNSERFQS